MHMHGHVHPQHKHHTMLNKTQRETMLSNEQVWTFGIVCYQELEKNCCNDTPDSFTVRSISYKHVAALCIFHSLNIQIDKRPLFCFSLIEMLFRLFYYSLFRCNLIPYSLNVFHVLYSFVSTFIFISGLLRLLKERIIKLIVINNK